MSDLNLARNQWLSLIGTVWLAGMLALTVVFWPKEPEPVVVTHWANPHMARSEVLPEMAARFNKGGYRIQAGRRIEVKVFNYNSTEQVDDLVSRSTGGVPRNRDIPDPVIVTPQADHWLVLANHMAGRTLVDLDNTEQMARTWIGIVTYRDMAECLGWPNKEIGYADIIALRSDPRGWAGYSCAKAEWGTKPLVAYTDPTISSTGRSALFSLYAIAAGKPAEQLTAADVADPAVVRYVRQFQGLVDHYLPTTILLNTQVYLGPRYAQFFLMPEDNLIHLYQGTESAVLGGAPAKAPPIPRPMVMIYPKEGSTQHNHSAGFVQAPWVTPEQVEAGQKWVAFLREDDQQRVFLARGFRPVTQLPVAEPISGRFGLDPSKPTVTVNPDRIDKSAAQAIVQSWDEVKKPGVVTFVADVSGSMQGEKLKQAKAGLVQALDNMARNNQVGLVTFADQVLSSVPVASIMGTRFALDDSVAKMRAQGNTALYDAIRAGIEMTDAAPADEDAIRGVVVLTDGRANRGQTCLDELIRMASRNESAIQSFCGFEDGPSPVDQAGRSVDRKNTMGTELVLGTRHPIKIFFIGIGNDADMEIGRMLAEATDADFRGATERDLSGVIAEFGGYF